MSALVALALFSGLATWYAGPYIGEPLYCDRGDGLIYSEDLPPWVAVDVGEYWSGRVQCGDMLAVKFANGETLRARAWDAGYLARHGIVVDVPLHLARKWRGEGIIGATVVNYSALGRALR